MEISLNQIEYAKNGNRWSIVSDESSQIDLKTVTNYENSLGFFRRLGGYERLERGYTCAGYKPVQLTSINPDKTIKIVRTFKYNY